MSEQVKRYKAAKQKAWNARDLTHCKCDHNEYCEHCWPDDFREGGKWHGKFVARQSARQPELTVWEGPMPESNGKSNFTAVLMRKGANLFDGIAGGMTIARSEYPDRVRYEADCVRWLIGELDNEPCIIDYDADKHSGYVAQQSAHVSVPVELLQDLHDLASDAVEHHRAAFAGYKLKRQANMDDVVDKARAILASTGQEVE